MTDEFDEFAGGTGLRSDYDAVVVDAYFTTDPAYNQGNTLVLKLKKRDDEGEEWEDFYPCGSGWGSFDGGETAEHERGSKHPFNVNSAVQQLVTAAFAAGGEEELRNRSRNSFNGLGAKAAGLWLGTRWHWEAQTDTFTITDKATGQPVQRSTTRVNPTKFLGVVDLGEGASGGPVGATSQGGSTAPAPTSATAATPGEVMPAASAPETAAGPEAGAGDPLSLVPAETAAKIRTLATVQSHTEWVDTVMSLPGVIDAGKVLISALADEAFYNSLKGA